MSYILDALQRAEAERARGGVPTLHTRPLSGATTPVLATPRRLGLAGLGLALLFIAAALAWWLWGSSFLQPTPAMTSVNANVPPLLAPAAPALTAAPTPTVMPAQPPTVAPSAPVQSIAPPPQLTTAAQAAATSTPKLQTPATPSTLVPLLSALPEDIRRQIPPLSISGLVYSADPTQRLLLMNGQVFNEGSQIAPDLSLVEIRSNNAEFDFLGTRFRIAR